MSRKTLLSVALAAALSLLGALAAQATSSTDAQANDPQVAGDSTSDTTAVFPTNKQNEPTIAVNPVNPKYLIAGANDEQLQPPCGPGPVRGEGALANDCSFFPDVGTNGVYTSSNGGRTWTNRGLLPGFTDYGDGGTLVSDGDPVIVYGPKPDGSGGFGYATGARAYHASLAGYATGQAPGMQAPELLSVSVSDDNGVTWSDPVVAASAHGYVFNDKEAIWADDNPASPFFGRVYVSWTQFRDIPGCAEPVMFAYSADGGTTWSVPSQLSPSQNCGLGGRQGSAIRTARNGIVYVVWEDSDVNGYKQVVAVSRDGGVSFSRPRTIAYIHDISLVGDRIPGSNFRVNSFVSVGVDQTTGTANSNAVYVAWSDLQGGTGVILVSKSTDRGRTWSTPVAASTSGDGFAFFQGLDVAPNGRVDLGYQALKATDPTTFGGGNAWIDSYYTSSTDGVTWAVSTDITSASSDPAASAQNNLARQFWGDYSTLVSTNSRAWFIYTDSRNGASCDAVDDYQHLIDAGSALPTDKPAPENDCLDQQFGNSDVYVSVIKP